MALLMKRDGLIWQHGRIIRRVADRQSRMTACQPILAASTRHGRSTMQGFRIGLADRSVTVDSERDMAGVIAAVLPDRVCAVDGPFGLATR